MTLLELLVVLAILATLAGIAITATTGVAEQSRYEATRQTIENIESAVLGEAGFLQDMGRLPVAQGTEPFEQLSELWLKGTLPDFSIQEAPGDAEVRLGAGWRGPYLRLGFGRSDLRDAYGNAFELFSVDDGDPNGLEPAEDGRAIVIIRSTGSDGLEGGDGYERDEVLVFAANAGAVSAGLADGTGNRWQGQIAVTVSKEEEGEAPDPAEGDRVLVRVYGPDGTGALQPIASQTLTVNGASVLSHTFSGLPLGPKIVRAYQENAGNLPAGNTPFGGAAPRPDWRSAPRTIPGDRPFPAAPVSLILTDH